MLYFAGEFSVLCWKCVCLAMIFAAGHPVFFYPEIKYFSPLVRIKHVLINIFILIRLMINSVMRGLN